MQAGTGECLRDLDLAHRGAKGLQSLHGVAHEVWKSIDRLWKLQERFRAEFISAFRPRGDRCRRDQESLGCLFERPAARGAIFENRQAFSGSVAWPSVRPDSTHASVLDAEFFSQQGDLFVQAIILRSYSDFRIDAVGGPTASIGDREVRQRDDM